jgi:lysophospholipase L1-like esterase
MLTRKTVSAGVRRYRTFSTLDHCFFFLVLLLAPTCSATASIESAEVPAAEQATYLAEVVGLLEKSWPQNQTINIVCHGHSVPAGYFQTPLVDTFNAYPHLLHRELKKRFPYAVINVTVTAIGGENSESGAGRFERDVLAGHPDLITLDYSLNDRHIGLERAHVSWSAMIRQAKERGIKVILLTPTGDLRSNFQDPEDPLHQHAEQVRSLAREHGVALVDSLAAFQAYTESAPLSDLMSQINHPNRKGHDLVVENIMQWFPE